MLASLAIRDIVLIDRLDLEFAGGMSVLTGETGAGKSILLDALSLALGGRGDAGLVRHGQDQGQVTAVFDVPMAHPARNILRENDISDDGDVILRRIQAADGRSRAFVNDQAVSVTLLRQIGASLVEIHGQHDARAFTDPAEHRLILDSFAGLEADREEVSAAFRAMRTAAKAMRDHEARIEAARREADYLRASVDELSELDPQPGEETELADRRHAMMQVEKIAGDLNEAYETLNGNGSPIPEIASLWRRLERKVDQAGSLLQGPVAALAAALDQLEDARSGLEAAVRSTDFDPRTLESVEERLFGLRAAARKFSVMVDDLPALRDRMSDDLAALDAGEAQLAGLARAAEETAALYATRARALSEKRRNAADALSSSVARELPDLKLDRARFLVEQTVTPDEGGPDGIDQIEFWVQTNPGTRPGPMMKVASGGELSRFLLALKVSLADRGSAPTLVFDEIDTGVGGAVAQAIGDRLARLARNVQVLTVTHAPQVAARAAGHFLISKVEADAERVATRVNRISSEHRREEIARMLAGARITDEARAAADSLLAEILT
ncbi:DNA repair protein RecN [Stappia sp. F7233]|uniref:DNA repair protein RecN n=1 Tax=Stappia albiluteola TaxID=2758565 RepID=A0A839AFI9_9HYPH|nr:DNA repair protein RecN [Stappia albiluteola]MBA5777798.1 DNA repair protein RecN [Stappia albiluteola]